MAAMQGMMGGGGGGGGGGGAMPDLAAMMQNLNQGQGGGVDDAEDVN